MFDIFNESVAQKDKFRAAANKLLTQCFLVKKKEDTKKDYLFVKENRDFFVPYFDLLGYDIRINEDQGVIALINRNGTGRLNLNKYDSILLLILRILYLDKRKELATFSEEVTVLMEEIREKYAVLKITAKPVLDKVTEKHMVSLFRKYNLIQNLDSDVNQADARIVIYPSIIMAIPVEDVNRYCEMTANKIQEYTKGIKDGESEEDVDQSTAD